MTKEDLDKILEIKFEINEHYIINNSFIPFLSFESSNYKLSEEEKTRAALMPKQLVLDDGSIFIKGGEWAYLDKNRRNILKINYSKTNTNFKE